jgi:hypothetical protein
MRLQNLDVGFVAKAKNVCLRVRWVVRQSLADRLRRHCAELRSDRGADPGCFGGRIFRRRIPPTGFGTLDLVSLTGAFDFARLTWCL